MRRVALSVIGFLALAGILGYVVTMGGSSAELPGLPAIGPAVVRTATLSIEVGEDGFVAAFDSASLVAGKYGGFVESSSTAGTKVQRGDLLIRVPADRFDEAVRR